MCTKRQAPKSYSQPRPSAATAIETVVIGARCSPRDRVTIDLGELTAKEARQLVTQFTDRGLITANGNATRVVPDLLADTFLENEAATGPNDLGFTTEPWDAFGTTHRERLITALSELGWRLGHRGGPDIMALVWDAIDDRLASNGPASFARELDLLKDVAYTYPADLVARLEALRHRLNTDRPEPSSDVESDDFDENDTLARPHGPRTTRCRPSANSMPRLYANAVRADPSLLLTVLDALWDLRRRDPRPTNSNPSSAARRCV